MRIYSYKTTEKAEKKAKKVWWKFKGIKFNWRKIFTWIFRIAASGILVLALLFLYYSKDLPDPNQLLDRQVPESTKIFARDGSLLYEIHGEYKRTQVTLDQIDENLKHATIAVEDKNFYNHRGISITGIARAIVVDIIQRRKAQGGSTITQQFVKKAMLTDDKSWDRKIRELILSLAIESRFTKDQILNLYLNEIPYGRNAYGIQAAAESYFNKSAKDLTVAESAYLAALPQAPTYYNPMGAHPEALENRKNTILMLMREQGYITAEQEKLALEEKIEFQKTRTAISAPHFVFYVQDYLANEYGEKTLEEGGLKVYTTLDPRLQKIAETVVKEGAEKNASKYNAHNASLVAIDPKTGQILAMVGSKDYFGKSTPEGCTPGKDCKFEPNVNVSTSPSRQPGSSFKPYVYVTAFKPEFKYSPATMLMDVTTNFGTYGGKNYIPSNYNGSNNGPVSMRKALAGSLNIPAVKTLALVGVNSAVQTARDLGITAPLQDCGLSLVLGGCEIKLLDHVAAYSVLANGGVRNDKTAILKIEGKGGVILEEYKSAPREVIDPKAVYELTSIMTDNDARSFVFGSKSPLILPDRVVAAKTGTTNSWVDGWTMGFTPSLAAGVWAGNNCGNNCPMKTNADGVFVAAPIWNAFMRQALADTPAETFKEPAGIKKVVVDAVSGKLPTDHTPQTKTEIFADYAVPTQYDDVHIQIAVDTTTGLPANSLTPPENTSYQTYTIFHSEKKDNPNWENPVIAWALANGYTYPNNNTEPNPVTPPSGNGPDITILEPNEGSTISTKPFRVSVSAVSVNPISRIDLFIDGQFFKSLSSSPFVFDIDKTLADGQHTIAIKAVDTAGASSDTSISINLALSTPIIIVEPNDNSTATFPMTLVAESSNFYNQLEFYYQGEKGQAKLIGSSSNITKVGEKYQFMVDWSGGLESGTYRIFAQSGSVITPKIRITVP